MPQHRSYSLLLPRLIPTGLLFLLLTTSFAFSQHEVVLQPWTEVKGTVFGDRLGYYVTDLTPSANLPYRAAVSHGGDGQGFTTFYRLQTPTDTIPQFTVRGADLKTGDFNDDGWTDAVVAISYADTVVIYWGLSSGLDTLHPLIIPGETATPDLYPAYVGDINNDGKTDLILTTTNDSLHRGKIYIYLNPISSSISSYGIPGESYGAFQPVSCVVGDLNNDGFNDLVVRAWKWDNLNISASRDYLNIYWGTSSGKVNGTPDLRLESAFIARNGLACFDVNGDGISDLLWTYRPVDSVITPRINVHFGGGKFDTIPNLALAIEGTHTLGNSIINAGDMNGDGYNDIAVGAYQEGTQGINGFVFIYCGGPHFESDWDAGKGMGNFCFFGWSIASLCDVNGDGLSDILVGAPDYDYNREKGYWGIFTGDTAIKVTGVKEEVQNPSIFELYQCYPNPFNPRTTIRYDLKEAAAIRLEIISIIGGQVSVLVDGHQGPGPHQALFDGAGMASGIYFYKLTATTNEGKQINAVKKIILVK